MRDKYQKFLNHPQCPFFQQNHYETGKQMCDYTFKKTDTTEAAFSTGRGSEVVLDKKAINLKID